MRTFRETLDQHLQAIQNRDLPALLDTLPAEALVLITSEGQLVRQVSEFRALHQGWFASSTWQLATELVSVREGTELAVAVLALEYRDQPPQGEPIHQRSYLTLIFAREQGKWVMVQDQNTPCR
jgi:uncharacterized protein (TIGR02246 family)